MNSENLLHRQPVEACQPEARHSLMDSDLDRRMEYALRSISNYEILKSCRQMNNTDTLNTILR